MKGDILKRALLASPIGGKPALLFAVTAVALPSLVRALLFHLVSAGAFLTYVPFVLLSAAILKPRDAALVALASAIAADFFFMPPHFGFTATADGLFGIAMLVIIAAMAIGIAIGIRRFARNALSPASNEAAGGVIFSERGGEAWANWEGDRAFRQTGSAQGRRRDDGRLYRPGRARRTPQQGKPEARALTI